MSSDEKPFMAPPTGITPPQPPAAAAEDELGQAAAPADDLGDTGQVRRTRTGGLWVGLVSAAVVLIVLLIFILQNRATSPFDFSASMASCPWRSRFSYPRCVVFCLSRFRALAGSCNCGAQSRDLAGLAGSGDPAELPCAARFACRPRNGLWPAGRPLTLCRNWILVRGGSGAPCLPMRVSRDETSG
jgi:uncharacterized integral membrane protein